MHLENNNYYLKNQYENNNYHPNQSINFSENRRGENFQIGEPYLSFLTQNNTIKSNLINNNKKIEDHNEPSTQTELTENFFWECLTNKIHLKIEKMMDKHFPSKFEKHKNLFDEKIYEKVFEEVYPFFESEKHHFIEKEVKKQILVLQSKKF